MVWSYWRNIGNRGSRGYYSLKVLVDQKLEIIKKQNSLIRFFLNIEIFYRLSCVHTIAKSTCSTFIQIALYTQTHALCLLVHIVERTKLHSAFMRQVLYSTMCTYKKITLKYRNNVSKI